MKKIVLFIAVILCILNVSGCTKNKEIKFDNSFPLATSPNVEWAVVVEPYVAFRKTTEWDSEILGHCRKGDILQVQGTSVSSDNEQWYNFIHGWLPFGSVEIYSNRLRAQTFANKLK